MRVLCLTDFPMEPPGYRWIWDHLPEQVNDVDFLWVETADRSARWGKVLTRYPAYFQLALRALNRCSASDYDLIVAWESKVGVPMALLRRLARRHSPPLVVLGFAAGYVPKVFYPLVRYALGAVDHVSVITGAEVGIYERIFGLPPVRTSQTWLGTYDLQGETQRQATAGESYQASYLHSSGRTARDYGTLFRAVEGLDTKLVVHGRDYSFKGLAVPANVESGGLVPREEYLQLVYNCLFEVIPLMEGVTHPAGASQAVLAMMMGKPVVATHTPCLAEFIESGVTGLLVEQGSVSQMRLAINRLLQHPEEREVMGVRARRRFEERYDFDVFARQSHEILHEVYHRSQGSE